MKKVAVVILNFKVADLTLKCVESVQKSSYSNLKIIVVDNNSGDQIAQKIAKFKDVEFIQSGENLGYSGGNNLGIKKALAENADFIFVLNPDTTIEKDTIKNLIDGMEEYHAEIANPKIYFSGTKTLWFAGKIFDFANVLGSHRGVDEKDTGQYDHDEEMEDVTGCALMVSREVFKKVGLFDDRYFLYYEDSDFGMRVRRMGYKIMYLPSAVVNHENAKSTGLGTPLQDYFITRNRMLFALKFLKFRTQFALYREAMRHLTTKARRMALTDFMTGNFGKGSFIAKQEAMHRDS